ncbi:MAG: TetR/AcrR family transcriptional regulator [Cellulosilyticum sp.]|nr:TetR/AcrR family transcriptional regulator [Cellulosilyticum sp.]
MRQNGNGIPFTERNQYARMCIAKALISILEHKSMEDITITSLVKVANVSRMTFYKYYASKQEVLADYMYEIVHAYMEDAARRGDIGKFREQKHICHCFTFFKQYSHTIMTLVKANMYSVIINAINDYMDYYVLSSKDYSKYELYYYAGALCNTYIKWIEGGMAETAEEISTVVYKHINRGKEKETSV